MEKVLAELKKTKEIQEAEKQFQNTITELANAEKLIERATLGKAAEFIREQFDSQKGIEGIKFNLEDLRHSLALINRALDNIDTTLKSEAERQAEMREREKKTLDALDAVLKRY